MGRFKDTFPGGFYPNSGRCDDPNCAACVAVNGKPNAAKDDAQPQQPVKEQQRAQAAAQMIHVNDMYRMLTDQMYQQMSMQAFQFKPWYAFGELEPPREPLPTSEQTEVITGWRVWYAIPLGSVTVLRSAYKDTLWPVGEPLRAHDLAQYGQSTGIHAFTTREEALKSTYVKALEKKPLFGTVALWGRVIEHEKGYRAEYAYPQKLYVPRGVADNITLAKSVAVTYGCEVEVEKLP